MKVPPKRKGNAHGAVTSVCGGTSLNESPSEKEGKFQYPHGWDSSFHASMKVPPKRKGNGARR